MEKNASAVKLKMEKKNIMYLVLVFHVTLSGRVLLFLFLSSWREMGPECSNRIHQ